MMQQRIWAAGFVALALSLPAGAQIAGSDHFPTSGGPVDIVPIHHASMMLAYQGAHILIDPAPLDGAQGDAVTAPYKAMPRPDFILVTISWRPFQCADPGGRGGREHGDRCAAECARRHARRVAGESPGDEKR